MSSRSDSRQQQQQQSLNADFVSYGMAPVGLISPQNLPCIRGGSSGASPPATSHIREQLCEIFMGQVDPVFKILHGPSLREFLVDGKPYLDYEPGHSAPAALASAVYYAAICSLSNEQCAVLFGNSKKVVVANYQRDAEAALLNADVTTTNDLTVLLAYVLFLVSRAGQFGVFCIDLRENQVSARSQGQSRRVWTMLSMALRVSQALSLHVPDPPFPVRPLEREMRRRLFQAVGFLDVQASLDHASEPMMQTGWLQSHPPSNINDSDIRFDMEGPVHDSDDFTDTTFTLMISKAQYVLRLLNVSGFTEPGVKYMHMRQQLVRDFQQTASNLLRKCQPDVNFHWFIKKTAECINASLQLIALRPLQQNANFTPPRVNEAGLLKLAVDVLQKTQELSTDPRGRAWSWFEGIFAPWHALAVAVAELCVCEDPSLMERYWPTVEEGYNRFSSVVTDSQQMTLWGPMEKIITRARARRDELLDTFAPAADTSNNQTTATSLFRATDSPSQGSPSLSGNDWQTQSPSFPHVASQEDDGAQNQISPTNMALSSPSNWLAPWPNLWDAIDFSYTGIESVCDTAWLNYETFIQDIYGSNESMSMLR